MKVQKRPRSSIRARRTACFSVSSSSRYMSFTSCRALSSWGCRSPFPGGWGREAALGTRAGPLHPRLGPPVGSLAVRLGTSGGPRDWGGQPGRRGSWKGWSPVQAERTDRQAHRKDTKAAKPPRPWGEQSPGQPGPPGAAVLRAVGRRPPGEQKLLSPGHSRRHCLWGEAPPIPGPGRERGSQQSRAWGGAAGWARGVGEGVSHGVPHSAQERCTTTAGATQSSSERTTESNKRQAWGCGRAGGKGPGGPGPHPAHPSAPGLARGPRTAPASAPAPPSLTDHRPRSSLA